MKLKKGIYKGNQLYGEEDENYTIRIITDENEYTASSMLMSPTEIYEITIEESEMQRPGQTEKSYSLNLKFKDNPVIENFYMIKFWENNEPVDSYTLIEDSYFAIGDTIEYSPMRISFEKNDEVIITIYSIDENAYVYYNQLNDALGEGMRSSSTPYNPLSNFGNDVMGYFVAWSYVSDTIIIE